VKKMPVSRADFNLRNPNVFWSAIGALISGVWLWVTIRRDSAPRPPL